MYVFAIAMTQLAAETRMGSQHFSGVVPSMFTLFVRGALLDEVSALFDDILAESLLVGVLLVLFILAASITVMNMLVGVLCQVVINVAEVEKEVLTVGKFESKLRAVAKRLDENQDGTISKQEFGNLLGDDEACKALQQVGVDVVGLIDYVDILFEAEDGELHQTLSLADFIEVVLDLRGSCSATVKDVVDLRKYTRNMLKRITVETDSCNTRLAHIEESLSKSLGIDGLDRRKGRKSTGSQGSLTAPKLRRSSTVASFQGGVVDHEDVKRDCEKAAGPVCKSQQHAATDTPPSRTSLTRASLDITKMMEKLDKSFDARFSRFEELVVYLSQDRLSSMGAPPPCSTLPSSLLVPRVVHGGGANSSHVRANVGGLPSPSTSVAAAAVAMHIPIPPDSASGCPNSVPDPLAL